MSWGYRDASGREIIRDGSAVADRVYKGRELCALALRSDDLPVMGLEDYEAGVSEALACLLAFSSRYDVDFPEALASAGGLRGEASGEVLALAERGDGSSASIARVFVQVLADNDPDVSWLEQTPAQLGSLSDAVANRRRLDAYRRGDWTTVGVRLAAEVVIQRAGRVDETLTLTTPGVWGIESDSGESYFRETAADESEMLADDLVALGFARDLVLVRLAFDLEPGRVVIEET